MLKNKKIATAITIILTALLAVVVYYYIYPRTNIVNPKMNSTSDNQSQPTKADQPNENTPSKVSQAPNKPTLSKSSGNVGSIASGTLVEFTCEGDVDLNCQITLENAADGEKIDLPSQKIESNGRGINLATFDWRSVPGKWTVVAIVTNATSHTNSSLPQTLEVKD